MTKDSVGCSAKEASKTDARPVTHFPMPPLKTPLRDYGPQSAQRNDSINADMAAGERWPIPVHAHRCGRGEPQVK